MRQTLRFRTFLPLLALLAALPSEAQNVGISADGATPDAKAVLDLNVGSLATKRGMLIPRLTRAQRVALEGNLGPADDGLWIYQTDDGSPYASKDAHGLFVFNGTTDAFERMSAGRVGWGLRGNNYADVITPFPYGLGTANSSPAVGKSFVLRSVNPPTAAPQLFIDGVSTGMVGLNNATPVERLDVGGAIHLSGPPAAMTNEGAIFYGDTGVTPTLDWHFGNIDGTTKGWRRLENAETLVAATTNNYPKDTLTCSVTPVAGSITQGVASGSSSAFPFRTGFTGEPPSADRGFRSQFIFRGTELTASGLCPGDITSIAFNAVSAENVNAQIRIKIRIANTTLTQFSAGVTWDNAVQSSTAVFNPSYVFGTLISPGPIIFNFSTPFNWTGGNIVMDVCGIRGNGTNGVNPAVSVENTSYPSTRYFNVVAVNPSFPTQGDLIDDQGPTAPATVVQPAASFSTANQRPVTTFNGNVKSTTYVNGTAPYILYSGALMIDSAAVASNAWAGANFKGPGTIRARYGAFDGTTQLSDHVFDRYYDGQVRPEDAKAAAGYDHVDLPQLKSYLEQERHLPNMPSRADWEMYGTRSLGELQTGLWETVETQALHIIELERDLSALETLAFGASQEPGYWERMIEEVKASPRLNEQQKLHLMDALRQRAAQQTPSK